VTVDIVRLTQEGEMQLRPGGSWMRFTATQEIATREIRFVWRARFRMFRVVDEYVGGRGRLDARLFGVVPILRARGDATDRGEMFRYLAELPWNPLARELNPALDWRDVDERTREVRAGSASVKFTLDDSGDAVEVRAAARPSLERGVAVERPWGAGFGDYRELGGVRIPARAEVWWELPERRRPYWRGRITGVELA